MYFWRLSPLRGELARGPLPPLEAMRYALASSLAFIVGAYLPNEIETVDAFTGAMLILSLLIAIGGFWLVYRANGGAVGQDFAGRYLALGWVMAVRTLMLLLALILVGLVFAVAIGLFADPSTGVFETLVSTAFGLIAVCAELWYYWRLRVHITRLAADTSFRIESVPLRGDQLASP